MLRGTGITSKKKAFRRKSRWPPQHQSLVTMIQVSHYASLKMQVPKARCSPLQDEKPLACASRALTPTQQRYKQIEKDKETGTTRTTIGR